MRLRDAPGALREQRNGRPRRAVLLVQSNGRGWSRRSVEMGILRS